MSIPVDTTLWCVNITGPDDVIAVATRQDAIMLASRFNKWWCEHVAAKGLHPYDPTTWAVPIRWPHDNASHAEGIGKMGDYEWLRLPSGMAEEPYGNRSLLDALVMAEAALAAEANNRGDEDATYAVPIAPALGKVRDALAKAGQQ